MEERKTMPLTNKEYYSFRNLYGMVNNFHEYSGDLRARCAMIPGAWRDMMLIAKKSEDLMKKIMFTIPSKKLMTMQKDLKHMVCEVRVAYDYAKRDEREFTYCPTESIDRLVDIIIKWECLSCDKSAKDAKKCAVFKAINDCFSWDIAPNGDKCPFAGMIGD